MSTPLPRRIGRAPDQAVLGCTHYEIVAPMFRAALPATTRSSTSRTRPPPPCSPTCDAGLEYDAGSSRRRRFLTTGAPGVRNGLVERFWGEPLAFESWQAGSP